MPNSYRLAAARARVWSLQTDTVLCRAASHGNELAFGELFRRHYPAVKSFVFHLLGARHRNEDAEDVVQDAFVRAFDAMNEQRFSGDFKRWLFTIARNRSFDLLRGERVRLVTLESAGIEVGPQLNGAATPAAVAETREEVAWLVHALAELPERQRSALLLRELAGLSHQEIAEEIGTTTASARQLIQRARDGVRASAERDGIDHEPLSDKHLRRKLLDTTPLLPLAAVGAVASAGTATGGTFAFAKFAATIFAAVVLAGSAGTVSREIADAKGAASTPAAAPIEPAVGLGPFSGDSTARAQRDAASGHRVKSDFSAHAPTADKVRSDRSDDRETQNAPAAGGQTPEARKESATPKSPIDALPQTEQPVKEIVELPGEVVQHVTDGLGGETPIDQTVGNVVGDVTETLDDVTSGLLGSGSH